VIASYRTAARHLVFHLIQKLSLGGATSCRVSRLGVYYLVRYYSCLIYNMFRSYKVIIRQITYVVATMCCFLVPCSKMLLKLG
jgi:hypothetical protein